VPAPESGGARRAAPGRGAPETVRKRSLDSASGHRAPARAPR